MAVERARRGWSRMVVYLDDFVGRSPADIGCPADLVEPAPAEPIEPAPTSTGPEGLIVGWVTMETEESLRELFLNRDRRRWR